MSEINTVDRPRIVAVETQHKAAESAAEAAKERRTTGKVLPVGRVANQAANAPEIQEIEQSRQIRVEQAVEQLNEYRQSLQRDLRFTLDEELGRTIVRVIDRSTQEVIRQIPSETAVQLARNLKAMQDIRVQENAARALNGSGSNAPADVSLGLINTRI